MNKSKFSQKQYTLNEQNYQLKIPMELDVFIPENNSVRLVSQFMEEMDLTELYSTYERMPSEKYVSPKTMLKIMLYAYHEGRDIEDLEAALAKIKEYDTKIHKCGARNNYSKTDNDAIFMHTKDDHMMNGQLKPAFKRHPLLHYPR